MLGLNILDWLETSVIPAGVDVVPDTLNLKSKGKWITCYIELPEGYDVFDIDVFTIMMNDTVPAESHPAEIADYDEDGVLDLMVKFNRTMVSEFILSKSITYDNATLIITAEADGILFEGTDNIRCVGAPVQHTLHFLAWIDGSDWLYLQGNEVWYVHRNYQYPGIHPP
jgi:hypothetical protein